MKGTLSTNQGACPVCGTDVLRTHAWNGARLSEHYACRACGDTVYQVRVQPMAIPIPA